jgi:predicted Ser/Thr protein kinase
LLDVEWRCLYGESPSEEEYRQRFADHAAVVRAVFHIVRSHSRYRDQELAPRSLHWGADQVKPTNPAPAQSPGATVPAAEIPASLGRYRVVSRLGHGGQGEVYRAVHPSLHRDVVIKLARRGLPEEECRKLLAEGEILAQLDDPGLVRVLDSDVQDGRPFVVFEYVRGRSLADIVRDERLSPRRAVALVAEIAATLERIHHKGIRHYDLKPANVLIDESGKPRLLDFGLACMAWLPHVIAASEGPCGTPAYMAPEQVRGQSEELGPWTDVFGLGTLLYHLLTGGPPYEGRSLVAVLVRAREGLARPCRRVNPAVPRALARICGKAMDPDPARRYANAARMRRALRGWLQRGRLAALGAACAIVLAGLALAFWPAAEKGGRLVAALEGELLVRVWSEDDKPGLRVEQPGALPVRNKEQIQIEVRLKQAAHVYLLWLGSGGTVWPLYPWNVGPKLVYKDAGAAPPRRAASTVISSPPEQEMGWIMTGRSGLETILMVARRTPLPAEVSVGELIGSLPSSALRRPRVGWCCVTPRRWVSPARRTRNAIPKRRRPRSIMAWCG